MDRITAILSEVEREVRRATAKHPPMHSPHEGFAVIQEEVDELWTDVKANNGREQCALDEAIQIAAMGVRYVLDLAPVGSAVDVFRIDGPRPFAHRDPDWRGYRVGVPGSPTIDVWVLRARYDSDGEGGSELNYDEVRLSDGTRSAECEDPDCDWYSDELHSAIRADLSYS